eukprot:scaffold42685_cov66-Phaeocystis_antarctica.AAC.1
MNAGVQATGSRQAWSSQVPQPSPGPAATPSLTLSVSSPTPCGEVSRSDSESSAAVRPGSNPDSASCPPACMGAQGGKSVGGL